MKARTRYASWTAAVLPLLCGLAGLAAALWLADRAGGSAGRGLVFIGFAALTMGLYGTVKRLLPHPRHTAKS